MSTVFSIFFLVPVSYINAAGDYLYFYYDDKAGADAKFMGFAGKMSGIYRILKNATVGLGLNEGRNLLNRYFRHLSKCFYGIV